MKNPAGTSNHNHHLTCVDSTQTPSTHAVVPSLNKSTRNAFPVCTTASRIEWLLQAGDRAEQIGADHFEFSRNAARLSIQPLLPLKYHASIATRDLRASGTKGKVTTLNLSAESAGHTTFLVVMGVLGGPTASAPQIELRNGRLTIRHECRTWTVAVQEPSGEADPARPLLELVQR